MKNNKLQKKVYIWTAGCQMNQYDSELIRSILDQKGYSFTQNEDAADIILLNTCAIRENAHRKVYGRIHAIHHKRKSIKNGKKSNPVKIGILGCMATNLRTDLLEDRHLNIDFVVGPDSYKQLPRLMEEACETGEKRFDVTLSEFETYSDITPSRQQGINAWIAVMRGCNNFCSFCVVPYTRGRERSRSIDNIAEEVRQLVPQGFKQVTLLGQNVNSYSHGGNDFAKLIDALSKVEGIERVRFTSPHPKDFPDNLLEVITNNPKVCKHIHLPLQAGNDRILDLMGRSYTRKEFMNLVIKIRGFYPAMTLTTDIIVGFPTETVEDFNETVAVMKEVEFDAAFIFKYAPRKGTAAIRKYADNVSDNEKAKRTVELNALQQQISLKKNLSMVGETHSILIEESIVKDSIKIFNGRTDGYKFVSFHGNGHTPGDSVDIDITSASPFGLKGKV